MSARPDRKAWWSPLGLALLCGHCVLGGAFAAAGAFGLIALPTLWGVPLAFVLPPALLASMFAFWVWSGRERPDACPIPHAGAVGHPDETARP